jgi:hypothetical protein
MGLKGDMEVGVISSGKTKLKLAGLQILFADLQARRRGNLLICRQAAYQRSKSSSVIEQCGM